MSGTTEEMASPARVLAMHQYLAEQYQHPTPELASYTRSMLERMVYVRDRIIEDEPESEKAKLLQAQSDLMLYPLRGPQDADLLMRLLAAYLADSRTYQVSAEMVDVVTAMYRKSAGKTQYITKAEIPHPMGFVWFDKPVTFRDAGLKTTSFRALNWGPQNVRWGIREYETDWLGRKVENPEQPVTGGVRLTAWLLDGDPDDYGADEPEIVRQANEAFGPLTMMHTTVLPFDMRIGGHGLATSATPDDLAQWIHALWMTMSTEITLHVAARADRGTTRRAEKTFKRPKPDIQVVMLRRVHVVDGKGNLLESNEPGSHRAIDWTCRWVVQGFDRHLDAYSGNRHKASPAYEGGPCEVCGGRTTHVGSFIKGPQDKPLKVSGSKVYRLAR